jgi:ketosteroid isomerase-like protein
LSRAQPEQPDSVGADAHLAVPGSDEARRDRARDTFDRAVALLLKHDMNGFAHLWAPTGTMDFPFAVGDQPLRLEGRPAIVDYLAGYTDMVDVRDVRVLVVHATGDPDTLVVEWESTGVAVATGREYRMPYVAVITVGPDGISSYRDYWNLAVAAAAFTPADPSGKAA